jgi:hypothetical protein
MQNKQELVQEILDNEVYLPLSGLRMKVAKALGGLPRSALMGLQTIINCKNKKAVTERLAGRDTPTRPKSGDQFKMFEQLCQVQYITKFSGVVHVSYLLKEATPNGWVDFCGHIPLQVYLSLVMVGKISEVKE